MASNNTALTVKVSTAFAKKYRRFCEKNALQLGKFAEQSLLEIMEDHYLGTRAQRELSTTSGEVVAHEQAFTASSKRMNKSKAR